MQAALRGDARISFVRDPTVLGGFHSRGRSRRDQRACGRGRFIACGDPSRAGFRLGQKMSNIHASVETCPGERCCCENLGWSQRSRLEIV